MKERIKRNESAIHRNSPTNVHFKRSKKLQSVLFRMRACEDSVEPCNSHCSRDDYEAHGKKTEISTDLRDETADGRANTKVTPGLFVESNSEREDSLREQIREAVREQIFGPNYVSKRTGKDDYHQINSSEKPKSLGATKHEQPGPSLMYIEEASPKHSESRIDGKIGTCVSKSASRKNKAFRQAASLSSGSGDGSDLSHNEFSSWHSTTSGSVSSTFSSHSETSGGKSTKKGVKGTGKVTQCL